MEWSEKELVAKAKAGNREAFDSLVRMYKDRMFSLTYRMTGDREAALDLVQETFFAAFTGIRRFREESSFASWLYRIASNKTINFLKRKKLLSFLPLVDNPAIEPSYKMDDTVDSTELRNEIARSVNGLPPKQKLVFNLRLYENLQFGEIARILGKSESTVKTNYRKAVEKLRKKLKNYR